MYSQVRSHPEISSATVATHADALVGYPLLPSALQTLEDHLVAGDLVYEYLARETDGALDLHLPDWPVDPLLTDYPYSDFVAPPFPTNDPPFFPASPQPPLPQEPNSQQHGRQPPEPRCRHGTPSFNSVRGKWSCSVCRDVFRDKYECERHIENVGKRTMCLACGKVVCGRRDNRKRHYTKYCKKKESGRDGNLGFEDAFIEVHGSST